ncbi:MAG: hypothetical protein ACREUZ_21085 [Burkholderiales bacterium]
MRKASSTLSGILAAFLLFGAAVRAQERTEPAAPQTPKPAAKPEPSDRTVEAPETPFHGQPINIRLELTITDQAGTGEPSKKVITLIVGDRQSGMIRSRGQLWVTERRAYSATFNVDAKPVILSDGRIRLDLGLEYQPTPPQAGAPASAPQSPITSDTTLLNERVGVVLESGKPLVISQAFDPASDRKVMVELKGTILK